MMIPPFNLPAPEGRSKPEDSEFPQAAATKIGLFQEQEARMEVEKLRHSVMLSRPLMAERQKIIDLPDVQVDFWCRAFSLCPEIMEHVSEMDSEILSEALHMLTVEHMEVDEQGNGEPRSLRFIFEFKENRFFDNTRLVKDFYWRPNVKRMNARGEDYSVGEGFISEPVRINWKTGADPTRGRLDAICNFVDARKRCHDHRKLPKLPEYKALVELAGYTFAGRLTGCLSSKVLVDNPNEEDDLSDDELGYANDAVEDEMTDGASTPRITEIISRFSTFFSFFGYCGSQLSAEDAAQAKEEDEKQHAKLLRGDIDVKFLLKNIHGHDPDHDNNKDSGNKSDSDDESGSIDLVSYFDEFEESRAFTLSDLYDEAMRYYLESFQMESEMDITSEADDMGDEWYSTDGSSETDEEDRADESYTKFLDQSDWSKPTGSPEEAYSHGMRFVSDE